MSKLLGVVLLKCYHTHITCCAVMIEKVHQLKKNVILCKIVPKRSRKTMCTLPLKRMPIYIQKVPPKNAKKIPPKLPHPWRTNNLSRVPCVIWELFRRMVYMYVPLFIKYVSNFLYMRYFIGKNCAYSLFSFIFASQIFMYNTSFFSL
jgi:hypothetical protein